MFLTELLPKPTEAGVEFTLLKYTSTVTLTTFVGRIILRDVADTYDYVRGVVTGTRKKSKHHHNG